MMRILAGVALVAWPVQASTTIVLRPSSTTPNSGDAYLRAAAPSTNFGGAGALVVSGAGAGNTNGEFQSVLKFDLAAVLSALDSTFGAGQWSIDSLALELTAVPPNNSTFNANAAGSVGVAWLATDSWTETGITWNGMSALISGGAQSMGAFFYNGGSPITTQYLLTSAAGFATDLATGGITSLRLFAADPDASMVMNSRNFGTAASRPALIITASPEPSRALLLLVGSAFVSLRRRRSSAGR